jgi:hypothetical protein
MFAEKTNLMLTSCPIGEGAASDAFSMIATATLCGGAFSGRTTITINNPEMSFV